MNLQNIFSSIKIFFNYLFETLTMRTKPEYTTVDDYETIHLNKSMTIER